MLYSATISDWVLDSGRKYLKNKYTFLNFVDNQGAKTATTIEVRHTFTGSPQMYFSF